MRPTLLILLALAGVSAVTVATPPPKCDATTLPTTVAGLEAPGQDPVAWILAKGVRLYDCSSGKPSVKSGGLVNVTSGGPGGKGSASIWTGNGVYPDANGNGTFVLTDSTDGSTFNLTLNYVDVLFVPAPDGALDWARWTVFSTPEGVAEELGAGWGSRVDTVGGAEPKSCARADANKQVKVPYTAYYYFYPCPEDKISGETATSSPSPAPTSGAPAAAGRFLAAGAMAAAAVLAF